MVSRQFLNNNKQSGERNMIGITSVNGLHLPIEERFSCIKAAGFDSILLWWGKNGDSSRPQRVLLAENYGLQIENVHASSDHLNRIWTDGSEGDAVISELSREIEDCSAFGIKTIILHLTNGDIPPPITEIGRKRIEKMIGLAERRKVQIAFENVRSAMPIRYILDTYTTPCVGLCYDIGHEHKWTPGIDWLDLYSDRIFAVHLHDNNGDTDSHLVPFDGNINWNEKIKALAVSSYQGAVAIESEYHASSLYETDGFEVFLKKAYEQGVVIENIISQYKKQESSANAKRSDTMI